MNIINEEPALCMKNPFFANSQNNSLNNTMRINIRRHLSMDNPNDISNLLSVREERKSEDS
jgi:NRPS condensation-like uncharacterized protein